jgi:putative oxidoreductase
MDRYLPLVGRILLSLIFLQAGIAHLLVPSPIVAGMTAKGIPLAGVLIIPTIAILIGGGLSILLGYRAKLGAWLLIGFLIPATLFFHTDFPEEKNSFFKNLGLMGGLLLIAAQGSGAFSLDRQQKP